MTKPLPIESLEDHKEEFHALTTEAIAELKAIQLKDGDKAVLKYAKKFFDKFLEQIENEAPVLCKKGCSFCCYDKIDVLEPEAKNIQQYVRDNNIPYDAKRAKMQHKRGYKNLKFAQNKCVFLSDEGSCNIYEVRPFICRTHNSIDTDPLLCKIDKGKKPVHMEAQSPDVAAVQCALMIMYGNNKELEGLSYYFRK